MYAYSYASKSSVPLCVVGNMMFSVILVLYGSMCEKFPFCTHVHTAFPFQFFPQLFLVCYLAE